MLQPLRRMARSLVPVFMLLTSGSAALAAGSTHDYAKENARSSPAWVHDGVVYEIFPRNFSARGDFAGVTAQLDRLQQLGVNILWLMPIHPLGKLKSKGTLGSPYAVRDYYGINSDYGSAEDLHRLIGAAHQRGLKVIIDIVANHTAWDSSLMAHPGYYTHDAKGKIVPPDPDWTDVADLDYDNQELRQYMIGMLVHWLKDFDLDGFRCDYAAGVPTDFWEPARAALSKVKPDIFMLAEADSPELLVKAFDADYAWTFYHTLADVLQNGKPASAISDNWRESAAHYPRGALRLRFTDNHDQRRAIARFGEPATLAANALMFTLDGLPLLYQGMEVGDTAESTAPALFEQLPVYWQADAVRPQYPQFFHDIIALRKAHSALRGGDVQWLHNSDESRVLSFARRDASESLVIAINLSNAPFTGVVTAGEGHYVDLTRGHAATATSLPALSLGAWEYRVYRGTATQ